MARLWSEPGFPHLDWRFVGVDDLRPEDGEDDYERGTCEACGRDDLRFVDTLKHDDYPTEIKTGCECASKLEGNSTAAKIREKALSNRAKRRKKWLTRNWRVSANGNEYLTHKGYKLGVSPQGLKWKYWLINTSNSHIFGKSGRYDTADEAKLALFKEAAAFFDW
jgi:hypothetical protein